MLVFTAEVGFFFSLVCIKLIISIVTRKNNFVCVANRLWLHMHQVKISIVSRKKNLRP